MHVVLLFKLDQFARYCGEPPQLPDVDVKPHIVPGRIIAFAENGKGQLCPVAVADKVERKATCRIEDPDYRRGHCEGGESFVSCQRTTVPATVTGRPGAGGSPPGERGR